LCGSSGLGRCQRLYDPQWCRRRRGLAEESLHSGDGRRRRGGHEGTEDVLIAGMDAALFRRNGRQMAAAGQRFLHDECRCHRLDEGVGVFRSYAPSFDDPMAIRCVRQGGACPSRPASGNSWRKLPSPTSPSPQLRWCILQPRVIFAWKPRRTGRYRRNIGLGAAEGIDSTGICTIASEFYFRGRTLPVVATCRYPPTFASAPTNQRCSTLLIGRSAAPSLQAWITDR
jgi:hypothetical protein